MNKQHAHLLLKVRVYVVNSLVLHGNFILLIQYKQVHTLTLFWYEKRYQLGNRYPCVDYLLDLY